MSSQTCSSERQGGRARWKRWLKPQHLSGHALPLQDVRDTIAQIGPQDIEPDSDGGPGARRLRQHVASDRRIASEDAAMRHGRKSSANTFPGFQDHVVVALDRGEAGDLSGWTDHAHGPRQDGPVPAAACDVCALRAQGPNAPRGQGSSVGLRDDAPFQQQLRAKRQTQHGRVALRKRPAVEHTIAHQWAHQGRRARDQGVRKNQFDGRRRAAVSTSRSPHMLRRSIHLPPAVPSH